MYLLDTVVLSELRKRHRNSGVVRFIEAAAPADLHLSVVTLAEIERGVGLKRKSDPEFAAGLARWLDQTIRLYSDRILPVTTDVARRWGQLSAAVGNDSLDLAIAATALEHGLTVVTRDVADFERAGALTIDPFTSPPR